MEAIQEAQVVEVVEVVEDQQVVVDLHQVVVEEVQVAVMIVNHLILGVLVDLVLVEDHNYICQKLF